MASWCDIRQAGPNWAHICYSDSTDYHRALLFNGHVTNNGAMIGVIPCNDKVIVTYIVVMDKSIISLYISVLGYFK